jgi:hypothetical protein
MKCTFDIGDKATLKSGLKIGHKYGILFFKEEAAQDCKDQILTITEKTKAGNYFVDKTECLLSGEMLRKAGV